MNEVHESELLRDPGGARPIVARWTITADLVLQSATHLGGEAGDAADMTVLRDERGGGPLLPGASIAGALRSHLADVLGGYRSEEDGRIAHLFGSVRGDDQGAQSPLIVFDSLGALASESRIEIRDGVQIESKSGIAEDHKKFDFEVLPAGTHFPLRFDVLVPDENSERELLRLLGAGLSGLSSGDIAIGARRSRGLGAIHATKWRARRYDLGSRDGWLAWLLSDAEQPVGETVHAFETARETCQAAHPSLVVDDYQDFRRRAVIDLELKCKGGVLVRSAPGEPDAPDAVHLRSAGRSVLPGTSLAGVMRRQAMRIARIVRGGKGDAERWIDCLIGPRLEGTSRVPESEAIWASRLRISESTIESGSRMRPSRVRIDRFTQGAVPGALFDEEPEYDGRVRVWVELREPQKGELGLLLLVLKDLMTGELPVGGTSAIGRGMFEGSGMLHFNGERIEVTPNVAARTIVEQAIEEAWTAPALGGQS